MWDSNLIVYPDGAQRQNRSGMACVWTSMNMGGNRSLLPCTSETLGTLGPCHNKEAFTNNTCVTHREQPFEYVDPQHDTSSSHRTPSTLTEFVKQ